MNILIFVYIFALSISRNFATDSNHSAVVTQTTSKENNPQLLVKTLNDTIRYAEGGSIHAAKLSTELHNNTINSNISTSKVGDHKNNASHIVPRKGTKFTTESIQNITGAKETKNETSLNNLTEKSILNETLTSPITKPTKTVFSEDSDNTYVMPLNKSGAPMREAQLSVENANRNLVIPVAITVFALPLFIVLGWYALRHGREAWKNRHYRRMDFLLDGMYND